LATTGAGSTTIATVIITAVFTMVASTAADFTVGVSTGADSAAVGLAEFTAAVECTAAPDTPAAATGNRTLTGVVSV
jgi:hypothetical protein